MKTKKEVVAKAIELYGEDYRLVELLKKLRSRKALNDYYRMMIDYEYAAKVNFNPKGLCRIETLHKWAFSDLGFRFWSNLDDKYGRER